MKDECEKICVGIVVVRSSQESRGSLMHEHLTLRTKLMKGWLCTLDWATKRKKRDKGRQKN